MRKREIALQVGIGGIIPLIIYTLIFKMGHISINMPLSEFVSYTSMILSILSILTGFEVTAISIVVGLLYSYSVDKKIQKQIIQQFLVPLISVIVLMVIFMLRLFIFGNDKVVGSFELIFFLTMFTFQSIVIVYTSIIFYLIITGELHPAKPDE